MYRGKLLKWRLLPEGALRKLQSVKTKAPAAPPASHPWQRDDVGAGGAFWKRIRAQADRRPAGPAGKTQQ